jgi:AraC family transcriptional regulator of adaptative response/methylated-DNA-[protein]-cysteine methyltransferase
VLLGDDSAQLQRDLQQRFPRTTIVDGGETLGELATAVVAYVESPARGLDVPLDVRGTEFQRNVWQALRDIPAGSTASYSEVATRIGKPKAVRAVAHACAANTLAVVIPCHRVVTTEGKVSGYRWGVDRKRALLRREATV